MATAPNVIAMAATTTDRKGIRIATSFGRAFTDETADGVRDAAEYTPRTPAVLT
jgi:hypothetical protein